MNRPRTWVTIGLALAVLAVIAIWRMVAPSNRTTQDRRVPTPVDARGGSISFGQPAAVPLGHQVACVVRRGAGTEVAAGALIKFSDVRGQLDPVVVVASDAGTWRGALPAGNYHVSASSGTWLSQREMTLTVPAPASAGQDAATACDVTLSEQGIAIAGTVVDPSGAPIKDAMVDATQLRGTTLTAGDEYGAAITDARGRFELTVRPGALQLRGQHPTFATAQTVLHVARPRADLELVLMPGSTISGTVVDASDRPHPAAVIRLTRPPSAWRRTVRADSAGAFGFAGLPPGAYELRAQDDALVTAAPVVVRLANYQASYDVTLRLELGASLRGMVVDTQGAAVAEAQVTSDGAMEPTTSDGNGAFRFVGVPKGVVELEASRANATTAEPTRVPIAGRDVDGVRLVVTPMRRVTGRVDPPQRARVRLSAASPFSTIAAGNAATGRWATTDDAGRFAFDRVGLGEWQLNAESAAGASGSALVPSMGPDDGVVISLQAGAAITGRVIGEDGAPLANHRVGVLPMADFNGTSQPVHATLNGRAQWAAEALTGDDGAFLLVGLPTGDQHLHVVDANGMVLPLRGPAVIALAAGERKQGVELVAGANANRLQITVVDDAGAAMPEAWVTLACDAFAADVPNGVGYVTDAPDEPGGAPLPRLTRLTDAAGHVSFPGLPKVACDVTASSGDDDRAAFVRIQDTNAALTIALQRPGSLRGTLAPFTPGEVYWLSAQPMTRADPVTQWISTATFDLAGFAPGSYRATITSPRGQADAAFEVRAGRATEVVFAFQEDGVLIGRVVDESGRARPGVPIWAFPVNASSMELPDDPPRTDANGRFSLTRPAGRWNVVAYWPSRVTPLTQAPVEVRAGQPTALGDLVESARP